MSLTHRENGIGDGPHGRTSPPLPATPAQQSLTATPGTCFEACRLEVLLLVPVPGLHGKRQQVLHELEGAGRIDGGWIHFQPSTSWNPQPEPEPYAPERFHHEERESALRANLAWHAEWHQGCRPEVHTLTFPASAVQWIEWLDDASGDEPVWDCPFDHEEGH